MWADDPAFADQTGTPVAANAANAVHEAVEGVKSGLSKAGKSAEEQKENFEKKLGNSFAAEQLQSANGLSLTSKLFFLGVIVALCGLFVRMTRGRGRRTQGLPIMREK